MKRAIASLLSLCIGFTSIPASADAYDAAMARAAAAKEKALDVNDAASWEEALLRFREADALKPTKESKYEVATAAAWLKQDDAAVEAYSESLALGLGDPAKTKAEAFIADRQGKLAKLSVTGPPGARVLIDGRLRGSLPHAHFVVFSGSIRVRVESANDAREDTIVTTTGAESTFDGTPKPVVIANPPAPVATPKPIETPKPVTTDASSNTVGTTLLIGGGTVLVLGIGTTLIAMARVKTAQTNADKYECTGHDGVYCNEMPAGTKDERRTEAQNAFNTLATWRAIRTTGVVTSIVGGVVAVTGGILLLNRGGKERASTGVSTTSFTALPGGGFLSLAGSF